jgi:hydroxymethylglutaryl-CoA lyase
MATVLPIARRLVRRTPFRHIRGLATASDSAAPRHLTGNRVRLVEVGPRDGLQNEKTVIPVATKIDLIERLARTGVTTIEAGSFVSPKWVPQVPDLPMRLPWLASCVDPALSRSNAGAPR